MPTTLKQIEAPPLTYPDAPENLSAAAAALDPNLVWERIEAYIAHRWTEREVIWVVEGCGEWVPPLAPVTTVTMIEQWSRGAAEWELLTTVQLSPSGGYWLGSTGPYRFSATVGGGSPSPGVPASVIEAYRRLAEYMAEPHNNPGTTSMDVNIGGLSESWRRPPDWLANAMVNSGAADLLRNFRRV